VVASEIETSEARDAVDLRLSMTLRGLRLMGPFVGQQERFECGVEYGETVHVLRELGSLPWLDDVTQSTECTEPILRV
jgi:hypothetical protein